MRATAPGSRTRPWHRSPSSKGPSTRRLEGQCDPTGTVWAMGHGPGRPQRTASAHKPAPADQSGDLHLGAEGAEPVEVGEHGTPCLPCRGGACAEGGWEPAAVQGPRRLRYLRLSPGADDRGGSRGDVGDPADAAHLKTRLTTYAIHDVRRCPKNVVGPGLAQQRSDICPIMPPG